MQIATDHGRRNACEMGFSRFTDLAGVNQPPGK